MNCEVETLDLVRHSPKCQWLKDERAGVAYGFRTCTCAKLMKDIHCDCYMQWVLPGAIEPRVFLLRLEEHLGERRPFLQEPYAVVRHGWRRCNPCWSGEYSYLLSAASGPGRGNFLATWVDEWECRRFFCHELWKLGIRSPQAQDLACNGAATPKVLMAQKRWEHERAMGEHGQTRTDTDRTRTGVV